MSNTPDALTLTCTRVPSNPMTLSAVDLTTIIDALAHARTSSNRALRDKALALEVDLVDWADNTGVNDPDAC